MPIACSLRAIVGVALLVAHAESRAAVLTVGPNGTYATLDAAFQVAAANGADDEIRIQTGTHATDATITHNEARTLDISGGWNAQFNNRTSDPTLTVLSGGGVDRVMNLEVGGGYVVVQLLTAANGNARAGGGMNIEVSGAGHLQMQNCIVRDSIAIFGTSSRGGGMLAVVSGSSARLDLENTLISGNASQSNNAMGGGLHLVVDSGIARLFGVDIRGNESVGSASAQGGGLWVDNAGGTSDIDIINTRIHGNSVAAALASGAGAWLDLSGISAQFKLRSSSIAGNADLSAVPSGYQVFLDAVDGTIRMGDLAVIGGVDAGGINALTTVSSQLLAVNLTVAGNSGIGFRQDSSSSATQVMQNSIAFANGAANRVVTGAGPRFDSVNLIDTDPLFVNTAAGNFRLAQGSPAINQGFNQPIGGLGIRDADYAPRVVGTTVDIGAYEYVSRIFQDGFDPE